MTQRNRHEIATNLRHILRQLLPSWRLSGSIRGLINKILMVLLVLAKLTNLSPAFAAQEPAKPQAIVINTGTDNVLTLSELWSSLNPEQRAILIAIELEVPDLAESLINKPHDTIIEFFTDAQTRLPQLPIWQKVQQLANDPNLPSTLPANTLELRSYINSKGNLAIAVADNDAYAKGISRIAWEYLEGAPTLFESTNNYTFTNDDKTALVDDLSDKLLERVFEENSNSS